MKGDVSSELDEFFLSHRLVLQPLLFHLVRGSLEVFPLAVRERQGLVVSHVTSRLGRPNFDGLASIGGRLTATVPRAVYVDED
jgi:hypothetical protein